MLHADVGAVRAALMTPANGLDAMPLVCESLEYTGESPAARTVKAKLRRSPSSSKRPQKQGFQIQGNKPGLHKLPHLDL